MLNNYNAVSRLYEWFNENKYHFLFANTELEFRDSGHGSAYVRLETKSYLSELCVWDHALCLNARCLDIEKETDIYLHEGSCESIEAFETQLQGFLAWFKSVKNSSKEA